MDSTHAANTKRIAKNTAVLYLRTIVTMLISLFTSRIVLEALGVDNFGIANVVGGVVTMFTVISGSLTSAIGRFFTYTLGQQDLKRLKVVFSSSINILLLLVLLIIVIGESLGIWLVNNKLNIPPDRLVAAHWVLQCSLVSFCLGILSTPYNASIVAHEKMNVFAYMTILDVVIKLLFAYIIFITPFDKLITYTVLNLAIALLMRVIYGVYCVRKFEECHYKFATFDRELFKEMTSFAGWTVLGNSVWLMGTQGINILINVFFGVAFNAARGVANQVESAVMAFVSNFTMSLNPQITKSYARGDKQYMYSLICNGSKYSFFLALIFMMPIFFETETILGIWLKNVPLHAPEFLKLSIIAALTTQYGNSSLVGIMATGRIRNYQIVTSIIGILVFPISWFLYKVGFSVYASYYCFIVIYAILVFVKLFFIRDLIGMKIYQFVKNSIFPSIKVVVASSIPVVTLALFTEPSVLRLLYTIVISLMSTGSAIYYLGLGESERMMFQIRLKKICNKLKFQCLEK